MSLACIGMAVCILPTFISVGGCFSGEGEGDRRLVKGLEYG